jgi:hypothetical protein
MSWLKKQCEETRKTIESYPEWLRKLMRFEGSER